MANTLQTLPNPIGRATRFLVATVDTATSIKHVDNAATDLKMLKAEVSAGSDFLLLWNKADPVVGTTAPHWQFPTETDLCIVFDEPVAFSEGLSLGVTNVGGTASSGAPSNANTVSMIVE